jgi:uncharacterized protein YbjT (DUF2867 family)
METTLIIGGNGKTGRRVAERLAALGAPHRIASRTGAPPFDWNDERTWPRALEGASAIYLTYHPDLAIPGAADRIDRLARRAVAAGTRKIVLLSGRGEPQVRPAEDAVRASGAATTILQCAFFDQNFSEGVLAPILDQIVFPGGDVAEPFLDADDIADVAVAALEGDAHAGKTYELTGPRLLTFAEAAAEIAAASNKPVRYVPIDFERYAEILSAEMSAREVTFLVELFRWLTDGHNAHVTSDVEGVLGRKPRDFRDYARAAAAAGAWR